MTGLILYALTGAVAGVMAGLLGIGGGLIIVPALLGVFGRLGFDPTVNVHLAVGTSLATIVLTAFSSARAHHQHKGVEWSVVARLIPGLLAGTLAGAAVAQALPATKLRVVWGVFVLTLALYMAFGPAPAPRQRGLSSRALALVGFGVGIVAALVGIGGGGLLVPYLVWRGVPVRQAVGTSAACGLPVALGGTLGYVIAGWGSAHLPPGATGYVYWPAVVGIGIFSVALAPLGAKLAHRVPVATLRRLFALFLMVVGAKMLVG